MSRGKAGLPVADDLKTLAELINAEHSKVEEGIRTTLAHALRVGDLLIWDKHRGSRAVAMALSSMDERTFPVPIGVFRSRVRPSFEEAMIAQMNAAKEARGGQELQELLNGPDTWEVK